MGEADVRPAADRVLAALRGAGRSEGTIRRHQVVLDRFAAFLAGRGLNSAGDQVCLDFIAGQTGTRLGALREPVRDKDVQAVRRPVVLMADALAGRAVVIGQPVIPAKDGCPARFRLLRDDYVASCRVRGNAEATVAAKDKAVSRFLGYLDEAGAGDLAALGVRDVSGFLLRQRGLRRKTIAGMRSSLADFLAFLAATGRTPQSLAGQLPPHRHLRHESEPHLWTAEEIRRLLAVIDRQSATGKRDYAMILMTARLGLRISDLRQLELGALDWRAKTITIVQRKTGRPLSLPLLDDVGWAIIDYVRDGRPASDCPEVFLRHTAPIGPFSDQDHLHQILVKHARVAHVSLSEQRRRGMHSLRHTLATRLMEDGTPVEQIADILGHQSVESTGVYLKSSLGLLAKCALDPDRPAREGLAR